MDFFIHKMCSGNIDSLTHLQFEKYSRGVFADKAIVQAKFSKGNYSFVTTSEYAGDFVRACADELGSSKTKVEGVIISTKALPSNIQHHGISQFMGVKKYSISGEYSGDEIKGICDSVPRSFVALSFSTPKSELKIKPKAPKSAKPGKDSEDGPKVDFCKLKTINPEFAKKLFFDVPEFKKAEVKHDFDIKDIEIPADEKDPVRMRERAIRKGVLVRKITVDDKTERKEIPFSV
ncbi:hypothetical protein J4423_03960 [Candidatus Pacearchaeota archaeon]|nr:hypothetical protein [Candidatus Pacearchaeota archaeon]